MVKANRSGIYEFHLPGSETDTVSLLELHLPVSATVVNAAPSVETRIERERRIVTLAGRIHAPELYYRMDR